MQAPEGAIVVPLDGSHGSERAVPAAVTFARLYRAPLVFLHVAEGVDEAAPAELRRAHDSFAAYARGLANAEAATGPVDAQLITGAPAAAIVEYAAAARLVVMATHGRGGFRATFIGSVADKVARTASVPLVLVPLESAWLALDRHPVVVALDGSEAAEDGLAAAREIARLAGSRLLLVRAYTVPPPAGIEFFVYPVDVSTALLEGAQEYLQKTVRPGEEPLLRYGAPEQVIPEVAAEADAALVVMTSHGKGLASRMVLGSVTDRVMHSLRRPLLIVRPRERGASDQ